MPVDYKHKSNSALALFHSASIQQVRLLPGIHGLRGIAAVAVVLFHSVHLANIAVPPPFAFIASYFGKGVQLFFCTRRIFFASFN